MEMSLEATIKIRPETRDNLNALKRGVETQDDVIRRLIDHYAQTRPLELHEMQRDLTDIEKEAED